MKPVLQLHQKEDGKKGAVFCSLVAAPQVTFVMYVTEARTCSRALNTEQNPVSLSRGHKCSIIRCTKCHSSLKSIELVTHCRVTLDQSCLIGRQLKVAASFRDTYLLDIYKVSIGLLKSVAENVISFNVEDADQ
ncbi:hypothetical protein M513_13848, partial [Trichuris suis]